MSSPLHYIKTKNSLRKKEKLHTIKQCIVDKIQRDIDMSKLRENQHIDNELILFVCYCVEELVKKKYNIDKKDFVVDILKTVFNNVLTELELNQIKSQIDFAHENQLIKKVELNYKVRLIVWDWIKRKFL
jgi:hypothetical protein